MDQSINVQRGFPAELRAAAAELYDSAFGAKLGIAIPDRATRVGLLADTFQPEFSIVAIQGDELLGIAGFKTSQGALTGGLSLGALQVHLGHLGTVRAAAVLSLFERELADGQLLMDGIAVAESARGQGVGTRLIETLLTHARDEGFASVRLDVIDTNPAARRLYERIGFEEVATDNFPYLKWLLGFSASTTLEYRIDQPSG